VAGLSFVLKDRKAFDRQMKRFREANKVLGGEPMQKVLRHFAVAGSDFIREALNKREGWAPLHPLTKFLKKHDRQLIETGAMEDSIEAWNEGDTWLAGIPPSATNSEGRNLAEIANIHEYGAHVPVTNAMRGFFAANGFPLKASTRFLRIPERPFLRPAADRLESYGEDKLEELMETILETFED
jgi:hypothetical protein